MTDTELLALNSNTRRHLTMRKQMINSKKKMLATIVEGDPKAPFSIATTPRCRRVRYSFPWIVLLYP